MNKINWMFLFWLYVDNQFSRNFQILQTLEHIERLQFSAFKGFFVKDHCSKKAKRFLE